MVDELKIFSALFKTSLKKTLHSTNKTEYRFGAMLPAKAMNPRKLRSEEYLRNPKGPEALCITLKNSNESKKFHPIQWIAIQTALLAVYGVK